jgi:hypothetical protein
MHEVELNDRGIEGDPLAQLERAFIDEFLRLRGHTLATLGALPIPDAHALLKAASAYASGRLAELESRARYVRALHDTTKAVLAAGRQKARSGSSE